MDTQAIKGRAVASLTAALALLVIVIFLSRAGKTPIILGLLTVILAIYGVRTLWQLKKVVPPSK